MMPAPSAGIHDHSTMEADTWAAADGRVDWLDGKDYRKLAG